MQVNTPSFNYSNSNTEEVNCVEREAQGKAEKAAAKAERNPDHAIPAEVMAKIMDRALIVREMSRFNGQELCKEDKLLAFNLAVSPEEDLVAQTWLRFINRGGKIADLGWSKEQFLNFVAEKGEQIGVPDLSQDGMGYRFGFMKDEVYELLYTLKKAPNLTQLDLSDRQLGRREDTYEIAYALEELTKLTHLSLASNPFGQMCPMQTDSLMSAVEKLQNLTHLDISNCCLGTGREGQLERIIDALKTLPNLKEVSTGFAIRKETLATLQEALPEDCELTSGASWGY